MHILTHGNHKNNGSAASQPLLRRRRGNFDLATDGAEALDRLRRGRPEKPIDRFLDRLGSYTPSGPGQWSARCPAHDDNNPSLSIGVGDDGRVLLTCHSSGCSFEEIVAALGLESSDLFPGKGQTAGNGRIATNGHAPERAITDPPHSAIRKESDPSSAKPATAPGAEQDWAEVARNFIKQSTHKSRNQLAARLGVTRKSLEALHVGWAQVGGRFVYTFPEHDGQGRIVGIATRSLDGSKRVIRGSKRGLYLPKGWFQRPGPIFVGEGPSDTAALTAMNLSGIGRPSATGGAEHLAELLAGVSNGRSIVVGGEMDAKPNGTWPGRDGAVKVARQLAGRLGRQILWTLPPDGAKDVREWLMAHQEAEDDDA